MTLCDAGIDLTSIPVLAAESSQQSRISLCKLLLELSSISNVYTTFTLETSFTSNYHGGGDHNGIIEMVWWW